MSLDGVIPQGHQGGEATVAGFSADVVCASADAPIEILVRGDLDLCSSPVLEAVLDDLPTRRSTIIIDLSAVTFLDSTGLRALWSIRQGISSGGGQTLLRSPSHAVTRVLKTTKLDKVFEYVGESG